MAPKPMYQKITKNCPTCSNPFETISNPVREKTYCSRKCLGKSRAFSVEEKRELWRQRSRKYRKEHPEWLRARNKRARQKLKETNPEYLIWLEIKKRAKGRGIKFELEESDIIISMEKFNQIFQQSSFQPQQSWLSYLPLRLAN